MSLLNALRKRLAKSLTEELLEYLETRALVLPSGVRDKIAKDYDVPVALIQIIEGKVRAAIIEHIRRWLGV
ncbi:MAG: hypothetical protein CFK49_07010 [Armatimonadetes bacterium JP3_11]|nr:MAG: hypothetical protein CFK49_07010 [Armatimonadetes bacterium JP3_11]